MSDEQIAANQLQIDSSLEAIDRISQVTQFQGRRLLDEGKPAAAVETSDEDEDQILRDMFLLTDKPSFFVANVKDDQLANIDQDSLVARVRKLGEDRGMPVVVISAAIEAEIMRLPEEEHPAGKEGTSSPTRCRRAGCGASSWPPLPSPHTWA